MRVLVTGMSGVGKSTLLEEMKQRGWVTIDTDYGAWKTDAESWHADRMTELLDAEAEVIVAGTVENQGQFYDRFDHIALLSAPAEILIERVRTRTNNPYGKSAAEQADIRRYIAEVEPLLRAGATLELDATLPIDILADTIQRLRAR